MEHTDTANDGTSSRLKEALQKCVVQKLDREVGFSVTDRRQRTSIIMELMIALQIL